MINKVFGALSLGGLYGFFAGFAIGSFFVGINSLYTLLLNLIYSINQFDLITTGTGFIFLGIALIIIFFLFNQKLNGLKNYNSTNNPIPKLFEKIYPVQTGKPLPATIGITTILTGFIIGLAIGFALPMIIYSFF